VLSSPLYRLVLIASFALAPLPAFADPLVKCPDFVFDVKKHDLRRADFLLANAPNGGATLQNSIYNDIPPRGLGNVATTKPKPDGTLDIGDVAQQRKGLFRPQILCKYDRTKIVIPLDLPAATKTCYAKGYCD
jgi:hypothetical protein